nr:MAG TPA: hypothetical protein [Bacteriophage sp.]
MSITLFLLFVCCQNVYYGVLYKHKETTILKLLEETKMEEIIKMANELVDNYTFELYCKLYEACEEAGLFFAEETSNDTFEFWIEDDHWVCNI